MAGFIDSLAGWKTHPTFTHVDFRITPKTHALILECKCSRCGGTFYWECQNPGRATDRINRWASWPCSMHR